MDGASKEWIHAPGGLHGLTASSGYVITVYLFKGGGGSEIHVGLWSEWRMRVYDLVSSNIQILRDRILGSQGSTNMSGMFFP